MEDTDLKEIYDESVVSKEGSVVSYLLVAVYAPIGLAFVTLRLLLSLLSSILASLSPALKSNSHFVNMYANLMGVYVQHDYSHPVSSSNRRLLIVSNHRSELDLLAVKSSLTDCSYLNETASQLSGLANMLLTPVWQNQTNSSSQAVDFFSNVKNYPVVVFPEQLPTKSRLLLKFDSAAFAPRFEADSEETTEQSNSNNLLLQPLVIELQRPILPLSLNHSSRIISTLLVLFSPVNVYRLTYLQPQVNGDECRQAIATKLGARLCQFSHEDVRKALIAKSQRANRVNRSNASQSTSSPSRSKMSFTDTSKLALQIKDILPNASYELIQRHIQAAPTLDIDTVLASILDDEQLNAEEEDSTSNSNNNPGDLLNSRAASFAASTSTSSNSSPLHHGGTKSTSALRHATNRFKSYEERKFELLNDARRRFLSKNPN